MNNVVFEVQLEKKNYCKFSLANSNMYQHFLTKNFHPTFPQKKKKNSSKPPPTQSCLTYLLEEKKKSPIIYIATNLSIRIYHDAYCLAKKIKIKKKEKEHK